MFFGIKIDLEGECAFKRHRAVGPGKTFCFFNLLRVSHGQILGHKAALTGDVTDSIVTESIQEP